ncbi:L,D-transpeptidase family protein [Streptomyces sp. AC555_RSS877]|uniref:L,D-transpeptidase family protein n=1 Tax=Streptomyces sp. AC555_RSS877 TaxID=2823688 RepID=UPI0020B6A8BF|nr:L,D-transpeptidase family protein [Streptomyces sp. AC555_RSS877]
MFDLFVVGEGILAGSADDRPAEPRAASTVAALRRFQFSRPGPQAGPGRLLDRAARTELAEAMTKAGPQPDARSSPRTARCGSASRAVRQNSWWCQDNDARSYNRWVEPRPADCGAAEAERLSSYGTQYAYALVIGFNYAKPVRGRGAGIFLHVNGPGATAGCVSVPADAMRRILAWAKPGKGPHIAIGTVSGRTAVARY